MGMGEMQEARCEMRGCKERAKNGSRMGRTRARTRTRRRHLPKRDEPSRMMMAGLALDEGFERQLRRSKAGTVDECGQLRSGKER